MKRWGTGEGTRVQVRHQGHGRGMVPMRGWGHKSEETSTGERQGTGDGTGAQVRGQGHRSEGRATGGRTEGHMGGPGAGECAGAQVHSQVSQVSTYGLKGRRGGW